MFFSHDVHSLITTLSSYFVLKDLGSRHHFQGIQVSTRKEGNLDLSQAQYIEDLLCKTSMLQSNPQPTPMKSFLRLRQDASKAIF